MVYKTKPLDLRPFGVFDVTRAVLTADADDGCKYRVSFDAGRTWRVVELNVPFDAAATDSRIVVEIKFPTKESDGIYTLNATGIFPLNVGTTVYFTDGTETFSTVVGPQGRYNITLPAGIYQVYYNQAGSRTVLLDDYNPEAFVYRQPDDLDKENTIQMFLSHMDWADYSVYDTFKDGSKIDPGSTAHIDIMQNLTATGSDAVVRYWALAFK